MFNTGARNKFDQFSFEWGDVILEAFVISLDENIVLGSNVDLILGDLDHWEYLVIWSLNDWGHVTKTLVESLSVEGVLGVEAQNVKSQETVRPENSSGNHGAEPSSEGLVGTILSVSKLEWFGEVILAFHVIWELAVCWHNSY
jgi:hypothetical protein